MIALCSKPVFTFFSFKSLKQIPILDIYFCPNRQNVWEIKTFFLMKLYNKNIKNIKYKNIKYLFFSYYHFLGYFFNHFIYIIGCTIDGLRD